MFGSRNSLTNVTDTPLLCSFGACEKAYRAIVMLLLPRVVHVSHSSALYTRFLTKRCSRLPKPFARLILDWGLQLRVPRHPLLGASHIRFQR